MDEKVLYCFKLNEETGEIEKIAITDYVKKCISESAKRYTYIYRYNNNLYVVYERNLDVLVNWKLHTFNPDQEVAFSIIENSIKEKADKSLNDYYRWTEVLRKVKGSKC